MLKASPKTAYQPNGMARRQGPYCLNGRVICSCLLELELCCDCGVAGGKSSKKKHGVPLNSNFAVYKLKSAENTVGEEMCFFFLKTQFCGRYFSLQRDLLNVQFTCWS